MEIKDIEGFENYQITDDGRVWSKKRKIFLSQVLTNGYKQIILYKDGVYNNKKIHRLVAETFIPNPDNKPEVDHINGDRADNRVENLRWCTHKENCNNLTTIKRYKSVIRKKTNGMQGKHHSEETKKKMSEIHKGKISCRRKIVYQYTLDGELVKIWPSVTEVGRNGFSEVCVSMCCRDEQKKHKGYLWSYRPL